jgi:hypothetical protein
MIRKWQGFPRFNSQDPEERFGKLSNAISAFEKFLSVTAVNGATTRNGVEATASPALTNSALRVNQYRKTLPSTGSA